MFGLLKKKEEFQIQVQEINTFDDLKVILEKYLNFDSIKQSNVNEFNNKGLLYSRYYEDRVMNKMMLEYFFEKKGYELDYKYDCEKKSINYDLEFLVFYKKNESASDNIYATNTYIDTHQKGKKSNIVAIKYKNIFVEVHII